MGIWCDVFKPGTWNGRKYGPETVDQMVEAFEANKDQLKVPLRLGDHAQIAPAAGWITGLKNVGGRLMAEFSDVPRVIGEAINKRRYKQVSIGVWFNWKDAEGKVWPCVINHAAILGGRIPAVRGLKDLPALFADDDHGDFVVITLENEEYDDMDEKILQGQITELQSQVKELRESVIALTKERDDLTAAADKAKTEHETALSAKDKEIKALQTKVTDFDEKSAKAEVEAVIELAVKEGRLLPAGKDAALSTGLTLRSMENFSKDDSPFATWLKGIESAAKILDFEEKAQTGGDDDKPGEKDTRTKEEREFATDFEEGAKLNAVSKDAE